MTTRQKLARGAVAAGVVIVALIVLRTLGAAASSPHQITLKANGGSSMDVSYLVGDKNSQDTAAASPWLVGYRWTGALPVVSMVVQNGGGGSTVSCSITEDGQVVNSNTAYGAYAVVQCSH